MDTAIKRVSKIFLVLLLGLGTLPGWFAAGEGKAYAAVGSFAGGTGTEHDPYQIATAEQLNEVRNDTDYSTYYILTDHIDLAGYGNWVPISGFNGKIDGNGYVISNLSISSDSDYAGLFADIGYSGKLINMKLENVNVRGQGYVGGLAGQSYGQIDKSSVTGVVYGKNNVGGLVGNLENSSISESYSTATVSGIDLTSDNEIGGLVGYVYEGVIHKSYATGDVNGNQRVGGLVGFSYRSSTISESYATGAVSGGTYFVGGLVGDHFQTTIRNSYAAGMVTGISYIGGLVGNTFQGLISNSAIAY